MKLLKSRIFLVIPCLLILSISCESLIKSEEAIQANLQTDTDQIPVPIEPITDSSLLMTLANVRSATAIYQDVNEAEEDGYMQATEFVPGMGFHYLKPGLLDGNINPLEPEALVYHNHSENEEKRMLGAVEYIIPFEIIDKESRAALDGKFPGVDSETWHQEEEIHSWTLHAWVWFSNPDGVFHPTNPRIGDDS